MRICILRLTSLGDVVHTLPVAQALRSHSSDTQVVWLAEEAAGILLANNPAVDRFVPVPIRRWQAELWNPLNAPRVATEFLALVRQVRGLHPDALVDVQGLLKSALFAVAIRPPVRVGFGWRQAREPLASMFLTQRVIPPPTAQHVVDKNLSLLEPLGVAVKSVEFPFPPFRAERERMARWLEDQRVTDHRTLVAILPATRRQNKQWPLESFVECARRIQRQANARFVVPVGPGEEALAERVARALAGSYVPLPPTSVPDLAELFRHVSLAIGNDTGPLHIAAAAGAPCIGLFGPTSGRRNGPYGPHCVSIDSPTGRIGDITVGDVVNAAMGTLSA